MLRSLPSAPDLREEDDEIDMEINGQDLKREQLFAQMIYLNERS